VYEGKNGTQTHRYRNGDCCSRYPPRQVPDNYQGGVELPYIRPGKGDVYSWADGHVALTSWAVMSHGENGILNWYYMRSTDDTPIGY
jgi:hypothetical protein